MRPLMFLAGVALALSTAVAHAQGRIITVTGTGEVSAPPDMATISLGVTTEADEAAAAMAANSEAVSRVIERLASAGIEDRDMQTSTLSLSPRRTQPGPEREREITGFVASNSLTVRIRDLPALGDILDAALADGANTLGGLTFGVADDAALREAARRAAVADAVETAAVLADAAGVTLGPVQDVTQVGDRGGPRPMARMDMAMSESVPIAAGETSVTAEVRMIFAIGD